MLCKPSAGNGGHKMSRCSWFTVYGNFKFYRGIIWRLHQKSFAKDLLARDSNVILLDEFDKANSIFHSAFYQLFDEGIFED